MGAPTARVSAISTSSSSRRGGALRKHYQIDQKDSWIVAAAEKNSDGRPEQEDSAGQHVRGVVHPRRREASAMRRVSSTVDLANWYTTTANTASISFFQLGGIAGTFPSAWSR
jgi:deoxyhypusine synthase